jgi:lipopolysaccharide export system protein LptA
VRRALTFALALGVAAAQAATKESDSPSILPGGNSKAPISIEADHLDYFEKEGKAVYTGRVIAIQGDTKLNCSKLTILMDKSQPSASANGASATPVAAAATGDANASAGGSAAAASSVKHMDCAGPVTVLSKTQTATADSGSYDKGHNSVILIGHVVLSDGRNVTKGDRLVYDLTTGQATVQGGGSGSGGGKRVTGLFLPGSSDPPNDGKKK